MTINGMPGDDTQTTTAPPASGAPTRAARVLAIGAVAGPIVFSLAWLLLGFVSKGYTLFGHEFAHYDPISQPISGLGMGTTAPYMNTAFIASGILIIVGMIGVFQTTRRRGRPGLRRVATVLLVMSGIGIIMDGIFNLEAVMAHLVGFALAAFTPIVGFLVAGVYFRTIPQWRRLGTWLLLGSPLTLILLIGFFATFTPTADGAEHGIAGLVERVLVTQLLAWFAIMGWRASRTNALR